MYKFIENNQGLLLVIVFLLEDIFLITLCDLNPEIRNTAIADLPLGVERANIVSFRFIIKWAINP